MRPFKLGIFALAGLFLAGCQQEAGFTAAFPPVGGGSTMALPDAGEPTDITRQSADGATAESLSAAVDEALQSTAGAQTAQPPQVEMAAAEPDSGTEIASDSGVLNLAEQSQAEQLRLRKKDAAALAAAAAQRVVIQPGQMPEVIANVNIITYARETTNAVGQRVYRRPTIRRLNSASQCAKFNNADDAQRNFLANGGPQDDPLNLDPDGDGFACRWSPEAYRALVLN